MRQIVALAAVVASLALSASVVVHGSGAVRSADDRATPAAGSCASPVAHPTGSPSPIATADHPAPSPAGTRPGTPVPSHPCDGTGTASARVEITLSEFAFAPSEIVIPADTDVVVVLTNAGSATHDFNVDGNNNPSDPNIHSGNVDSGHSVTLTINLPAGDWYAYCGIMGHYSLGMEGTIRAR